VVGPLQGFKQMWQKTYRVRVEGASASPSEVVRVWSGRIPELWVPDNRFLAPLLHAGASRLRQKSHRGADPGEDPRKE
jgi:hypothetical protein